jgi:hypothetical protein
MPELNQAITQRIQLLPDCYGPLKRHFLKGVCSDCQIGEDGSYKIGRNIKCAPEYFVFTIYPPAKPDWLAKRRSFEVPVEYLKFLSYANGCFAYSISFYGFTPSMEENPPTLQRRSSQCHDLTTANTMWIRSYKNVGDEIYIGSRSFSRSENLGYFMDDNGRIIAMKKNGEQIGEWFSFCEFLEHELPIAENMNKNRNPF